MLLLKDGEIGRNYFVVDLQVEHSIERRLEALGMTTDTEITILNRKKQGALILKVRGTRFAVGQKIAGGIQVREVCPDE